MTEDLPNTISEKGSLPEGTLRVDIIMPVFNNEDTIGESILSIYGQEFDGLLRLIIVDDGSDDDSGLTMERAKKELSCESFEVVTFYFPNRGEAAAINKGLNYIFSHEPLPDFIGIVEADVKLEPDWLRLLLSEFGKAPAANVASDEVFGVGGLLLPWDGLSPVARLAGYDVEYRMLREGKIVTHLTSANVLYRREVFERFGRFNERLKNAALDNDFNFRVVSAGKKLVRCFEAKAYHKYKPTLMSFLKRQYYYAKYRPFLKYSSSYQADSLIKGGVFLALLSLCSLLGLASLALSAKLWWVGLIPACLLVTNLLLNCVPLPDILKRHKDPAIVLYPGLMVLRAFAGLWGYGIGLLLFISWAASGKLRKYREYQAILQ